MQSSLRPAEEKRDRADAPMRRWGVEAREKSGRGGAETRRKTRRRASGKALSFIGDALGGPLREFFSALPRRRRARRQEFSPSLERRLPRHWGSGVRRRVRRAPLTFLTLRRAAPPRQEFSSSMNGGARRGSAAKRRVRGNARLPRSPPGAEPRAEHLSRSSSSRIFSASPRLRVACWLPATRK